MLQVGGDPNYANRYGRTPLMAAASSGSAACCVALLRAGAAVGGVDCEGRSAGQYAHENAMPHLTRFLVNVGASGLDAALEVRRKGGGRRRGGGLGKNTRRTGREVPSF